MTKAEEHLRLNADPGRRVVTDTRALAWEASPSATVWRKRLHIDGPKESAKVTSIVRYDAGSAFPAHGHPDGEEIFVLDGVFSDETGDYPAGSYLLNPEGFRHAPRSQPGCTLFVKLRQYPGLDRLQVRRDTRSLPWTARGNGIHDVPLYRQDGYPDYACLVRFDPGVRAPHHGHPQGEEVLVLDGVLEDEMGVYPAGTWIRNPIGSAHQPFSADGCTFLLKTGNLVP
ncbi:MAG: cupin domain-containing protein [Rhodospirillaceae bacterium]